MLFLFLRWTHTPQKDSVGKSFWMLRMSQGSSCENKAILRFADRTFFGKTDASCTLSGEVVFTTGMMGYEQTMTDPSYHGQILVFTYPLIGNYGLPTEALESEHGHPLAIIVSHAEENFHHPQAHHTLKTWLKEKGIPLIWGVDTRALTAYLREQGTAHATLILGEGEQIIQPKEVFSVSTKKIVYHHAKDPKATCLLIDCGVKKNMIQSVLARNIDVIQVPHDMDIFSPELPVYEGIIVSNGPGDPTQWKPTIANIKEAMAHNIPIFGICLGNQILALAAGGTTHKLPYGHRSQNQPCNLVGTKKYFLTSQNHGYVVDMKSLNRQWKEFFVNGNDGSNEGIIHESKRFFSVQFHPEASPGPMDTTFLFDDWAQLLVREKHAK